MKNICFIANNIDEQWNLLEEAFKLPPEKRTEFLLQKMKEKKATCLGVTEKSAPELAVDCLKKGLKAKSYGHKGQK